MRSLPTADRVRALLTYDKATGAFTWLPRDRSEFASDKSAKTWNTRFAGQRCGCIDESSGYEVIRVEGQQHRAHRLAWLFVTGQWPVYEVDHRNGIRSDNKWLNLRDVTTQVNNQNRRSAAPESATGLLGATPLKKTGKFQARIRTAGTTKYLGSFSTPEAAHAAYVAAKRQLHEGCTL